MTQREEIYKKLVKIFDSLLKELNSLSLQKYLASFSINYLQVIADDLNTSYSQSSENLLSSLLKKLDDLSQLFALLKTKNFFNFFGLYQKNEQIIEKYVQIMNDLINIAKPLLKISPFSVIILDKKVRKALDSSVEACEANIVNLKNEKKVSSEFKKNFKQITEELTYIFWFKSLGKESEIDDKEFLNQMERVLKVLGKDMQRMYRDKLLDEVDEKRLNAITPDNMMELFRLGLSHPTAYIYDLPENMVDSESDEEKTLKRKKKTKEQMEEVKNEDSCYEEPTIKAKKTNQKPDISAHFKDEKDESTPKKIVKKKDDKKNEETSKNDFKKKPFSFKNHHLDESLKIEQLPLILQVLETNEKAPGLFKQNSRITITADTYQIDNQPPVKLLTRYVTKFGRESDMADLQADLKFDKKLREISRKQFHILGNDQINHSYKIICTSPPPKSETVFKISDQPFLLQKDNIITLGDDEILQIDELYDNIERESEKMEENSDDETELHAKKRKKAKAEQAAREKKQQEIKQANQGNPFIVFDGVAEDSESYNKKEKIEAKKYPNGYIFGKDWVFKKNEKANTGACLFFVQNEGWYIKSHKLANEKFKIFETKVSVGLYGKITQGLNSDPVDLKKGIIIHINGFSFKVE